jgi:hypothetical protein
MRKLKKNYLIPLGHDVEFLDYFVKERMDAEDYARLS